MSGRRRQGLSPSLFPFLAVLVCTLGTLILLLALVAENATDAAEQQKANEAAKLAASEDAAPTLSADMAGSMIEEEKFRVEQLVAFRDAQTTELAQRKDQLTHLEDHIVRISEKLKQLSDEVEMATGTKPVDVVDETKLASLRQQIDQESKTLEKLREEKADTSPRVVIVPHKGPNGTDRRPIYIECDANGVTIQPEGTRISLSQLKDSDASANPLDAALRVIRHHALNHYRDPIAPYPLLVVRPGGIESYSEARGAMQDWDDQFGYELVSEDLKLAFNQPDPQLRQRTYLAIREAVLKQRAKNTIAVRRGYGGGGVSDRGRRYPTLSAKSMGRQGTASGFRSADDSNYPGSSYTSNSYNASRMGDVGTSERLDDRLRTAIDELKNEGAGAGGVGANPVSSLPRTNQFARSEGSLESGQFGPYSSADRFEATPGDQTPGPGQRAGQPTGQRPGQGTGQRTGQLAGQFMGKQTGQPASQQTGQGTGQQASQDAGQQDSQDTGQQASQPTEGGDQKTSASEKVAAILRGEVASESMAGKSSGNSNAASQVPTQGDSRSASASRAGAPSMPASDSKEAQSQPPASVTATNRDPSSMVKREGNNWALPKSVARSHGNAIVRGIRVQCYRDRLVLLPSREESATEVFGVADGDITRATLELATAVRDRIDRWGAAIPGGRWQPRMDVEVMPDGETRYHQIRTLMNGSGVEVQGRTSP